MYEYMENHILSDICCTINFLILSLFHTCGDLLPVFPIFLEKEYAWRLEDQDGLVFVKTRKRKPGHKYKTKTDVMNFRIVSNILFKISPN